MDPTSLSLPPLAAAFVFGLLGGAHCIGMCGGIMSALTFAVPPSMRQPGRLAGLLLGYNFGRITSYMVAGALVALLGSVLNHALDGIALTLRILAAVMLILMALYIANWWKGLSRVEALGRSLWRRIEPYGRSLLLVSMLLGPLGKYRSPGCVPPGRLATTIVPWPIPSALALHTSCR